MTYFDSTMPRGGALAALLMLSAMGCASLEKLEKVSNVATANDECPACGALPDEPCNCRPDSSVGGFTPTSWVHYEVEDFDDATVARLARADASRAEDAAAVTDRIAAEPSAAELMTPELPTVQLVGAELPTQQGPRQQEPEVAMAVDASVEVVPAVAKQPEVQLAAYEQLPPELLPDGGAPATRPDSTEEPIVPDEAIDDDAPPVGAPLVGELPPELSGAYPMCETCGQRGRAGDMHWLPRHRCATHPAPPDVWRRGHRAMHWRRAFADYVLSAGNCCAAGDCGACQDWSDAQPLESTPAPAEVSPSTPSTPPQPEIEAAYQLPPELQESIPAQIAAESQAMAGYYPNPAGIACQSCSTCDASGNACGACAPVYLLDKVICGVKQSPVMAPVMRHMADQRPHCAGPPDPWCYGYTATHWREMGSECNVPHHFGMPIDRFPSAGVAAPVDRVAEPEEIAPPAPGEPQQPIPPLELPDVPQLDGGPRPDLPPRIPELFPDQGQPEPEQPGREQPDFDPDEVPDLFPRKPPADDAEENRGVVRFSAKQRPGAAQPQRREPSALNPIRRTSAASLPVARRELRFAPTVTREPINPAGYEHQEPARD